MVFRVDVVGMTVIQHRHTDGRYPGESSTCKMVNVRGLLVLCFVCLLLCQVVHVTEACPRKKTDTRTCSSARCRAYTCKRWETCTSNCGCG
ncbi:hypothetical protein LSAT2_027029 [Lamellibrachia satsuma]|nr:hypothetical protein LSAT2_027029 [Lamellibrachia satsuma]